MPDWLAIIIALCAFAGIVYLGRTGKIKKFLKSIKK